LGRRGFVSVMSASPHPGLPRRTRERLPPATPMPAPLASLSMPGRALAASPRRDFWSPPASGLWRCAMIA
jgi:hypothetical protein